MKIGTRYLTAILILNFVIQIVSYNLDVQDPSTIIVENLCGCRIRCTVYSKCVLAYWKPLQDSFLCMIQTDASIPLVLTAGVQFYCRGCLIMRAEVDQLISIGAVQLLSVARNKRTDVSSEFLNQGVVFRHAYQAVDGDHATRWASSYAQCTTNSKEWIMIDLGREYIVCQIRLYAVFLDRISSLKIFHSNTFNRDDDFSATGTYPEILDVPGPSPSLSMTYNIENIVSGRYIIVQRQNLREYLHLVEIEVFTPVFV